MEEEEGGPFIFKIRRSTGDLRQKKADIHLTRYSSQVIVAHPERAWGVEREGVPHPARNGAPTNQRHRKQSPLLTLYKSLKKKQQGSYDKTTKQLATIHPVKKQGVVSEYRSRESIMSCVLGNS